MESYKFEVIVSGKLDVLDPEGRAICETFRRKDYPVLDVRVSKRFEVSLQGSATECTEKVEQLARLHLSNPVAEDYKVKRLPSE